MKETVRIWSQNYSEVLLTTKDREVAKQFVVDSGEEWLPIVIDYGTDLGQRWSGRCEVIGGAVTAHQDHEYLQYIQQWPSIALPQG